MHDLQSSSETDVTLPKRPFAFAVRRAPDNGPDQWRSAMQLDGDYEALYRVGDRRSAMDCGMALPSKHSEAS